MVKFDIYSPPNRDNGDIFLVSFAFLPNQSRRLSSEKFRGEKVQKLFQKLKSNFFFGPMPFHTKLEQQLPDPEIQDSNCKIPRAPDSETLVLKFEILRIY